ncbi:MAG: large conductance mechanosensitive channel protein MscL [Robiginitalea sp.]|uniref:large conductance mechanosensitive channel protein MscL n=1 Tax=Robiginitalea sp. TaxID=1902411 RepID=UPI003C76ED36
MLKEFRAFIMTGNVIDLAVAVLLAGAVGLVVNGFVNDIMMPIVGYFAGGIDFSDFKIILSEAVIGSDGNVVTPESAIRYGAWINSIINLIIVGFVLFMIVKSYNKVRVKEEAPAPEPAGPTQEELLAEIRDLLKKK